MRDVLTMRAVYIYMSRALRAAGALLAYPAAEGARWSNASLVLPLSPPLPRTLPLTLTLPLPLTR